MRTKYKAWAVEYLHSGSKNQIIYDEFMADVYDDLVAYVSAKPTFLEVGPGKGKFIIEMAKKFPDVQFLGIEVNPTVAGICLKAIDESGLDNVKLIFGNFESFRYVYDKLKFEGIFLNFSDPWPKHRHTGRRLTHPKFLKLYYHFLNEGGKVYFKSDNKDFFVFSYVMFKAHGWELSEISKDYKELVDFDSRTEFETKYIAEGKPIYRFVATKTKETEEELSERDYELLEEGLSNGIQ